MKKLNRDEIMKILPHRDDMLLLDEAWDGGGSYKIRGDEFFLRGHFKDNPIVPGVILCEIMAQSACATIHGTLDGKTPMLTGFDNVRIRNKVVPGDVLWTEVTIKSQKAPFYFIDVVGYVGEKRSISGTLMFAVV